MADKKFSQLDPATTLDGNETVPMIQGGVPVRSTVSDILAKQHGHAISDVTGLQTALDGKSATSHTHDDRYYTESETDTLLAGKSSTSHNHNLNDLTEKSYNSLTDKPTLGTAAPLNVAATGNAATGEVVKGNDTRLSDARTPTTHTHTASQVTDFDTEVSNNTDVAANTTARHTHSNKTTLDAITAAFTTADETKLDGIATGATANDTDANLKNRANHTGTQTASTISDLQETVEDLIGTKIVAGSNVTVSYNDTTGETTIASSGGAGGSPAGSTTQIQFNDAGAFGGDADLTWDKTTNDLVLGGTDTGITLQGITNEPSAASSGKLHFYSKDIGGRMLPKIIGPSGVDSALQTHFATNNIRLWTPTTATAGVWLGTAGAGAGTYTTALPTDTSLYTSIKRARWANVVTTTNQVLGQRNTEAMFYRGSAVSGAGGFFFYARLGFDVWTNGGRFFAGMHSATTVVSADPSALNNTVGFCVDAADNGLIHFLTRGTSATKASTGLTITSGKGYDVTIFCAPGSSQYTWRIVDLNTGTVASGTATLTLPTNTTKLTAGVLASNAALTTATAIQLGVNRIYIETDY